MSVRKHTGTRETGTWRDQHHADEDFSNATRSAFDAMRRQLEEYARQRRGGVNMHEDPLLIGRVTKLVPAKDRGLEFLTAVGAGHCNS